MSAVIKKMCREEREYCQNCGERLTGRFCHACGQQARSFITAFPGLIKEVAGETFYYDSRMWRTLGALLLSPGLLSDRYVAGRRARYTPPVRLYLVCSILAFLLVGLVINTTTFTPWTDQFESDVVDAEIGSFGLHFGDQPWHEDLNPVELAWLGHSGNNWLNRQIAQVASNAREVERNPLRLLKTAAGMLPQTMFVLLPLFAVMVAMLYLFAGRYYIEHLLLQVHNHAFIFLALIAIYLFGSLRGALLAAEWPLSDLIGRLAGFLVVIVWLWIPTYLLLSLKRFYRQSWLMTITKFLVLGWSYLLLLTIALTLLALVGIWRL